MNDVAHSPLVILHSFNNFNRKNYTKTMKGLYRTIYYFSFPFVVLFNVMLKDEAQIILKNPLIKDC